jgi:GNAT superfamily N-acetyltransferase
VERVAVGDEERVSAILTEAATWLAGRGEPNRALESVSTAAVVDGADVATWFHQARDPLWWPEFGADDDRHRYLHKFAVRRRAAGTGVSSAVIAWNVEATRRAGSRWLRLDCLDRPAMRSRYERAGFVLDRVLPHPQHPELSSCRYALDVLTSFPFSS